MTMQRQIFLSSTIYLYHGFQIQKCVPCVLYPNLGAISNIDVLQRCYRLLCQEEILIQNNLSKLADIKLPCVNIY